MKCTYFFFSKIIMLTNDFKIVKLFLNIHLIERSETYNIFIINTTINIPRYFTYMLSSKNIELGKCFFF